MLTLFPQLDEFCIHRLDHVVDAEWKWLRSEWQARGRDG